MKDRTLSGRVVVISLPSWKAMTLTPALPNRAWMNSLDATDRWLPTSIANQAGWMLLNDEEIEITWNGGSSPSDLSILGRNYGASLRVVSQFGSGIATWKLPFLFRFPIDMNLRLRGPTNLPREGAFPIEQILDAASSFAGASMNWKLTAIGTPVRFEIGEPICMIYPELSGLADDVDPQIHALEGGIVPKGEASASYTNRAASKLPDRQTDQVLPVNETMMVAGDTGEMSDSRKEGASRQEVERPSLGAERQSRSVTLGSAARLERFWVEKDFYDRALMLREQFQHVISSVNPTDPTANPLTYAYQENAYQLVAASAERVFSADLLFSLLDRLRAWARQNLGATHASTPRLHVYINGNQRCFAKDDIRAGWHYLLSLTRNEKPSRQVRVLLESASEIWDSRFGLGRVTRVNLDFNAILIHDAKRAYGIDRFKGSTNPSEGFVLLDGYLW